MRVKLAVVALLAVAGCASSTGGPSSGEEPPQVNRQATSTPAAHEKAACDLHKSKLTFPGACGACMQASCCEETVACFAKNPSGARPDCADLVACVATCPEDDVRAPPPGSIASSANDAGAAEGPCHAACVAAHHADAAPARSFRACHAARCAKECGA